MKPAVIGSEFALTMNGNGINHNFRVHPFPTLSQTSDVTALVVRKSVFVHPLVQVTRVANTAWNFTLSTSVPLPLTANTEVAIPAAGSDVLRVYRFDGLATPALQSGRATRSGDFAESAGHASDSAAAGEPDEQRKHLQRPE